MKYLFSLLFFLCSIAKGQEIKTSNKGSLMPGEIYPDVVLPGTTTDQYTLELKKDGYYKFKIMQKGIDVTVKLVDPQGKIVVEKDSPNGTDGPEDFELSAPASGSYSLMIIPFNDSTTTPGKYSLYYKKLSKKELRRDTEIKKELAVENKKDVLTLDIDHFWEAYDHLPACKTFKDSVASFQDRYIDKATDGFKDFLLVRNFTAAEYAATVRKYPKFFNSVRPNTFKVKNAVPLIEEVFTNFKKLYPGFKPFKVCFAIGTIRTGGTTSSKFVLIGTEISTSTKYTDLSEFRGNALSKVMAGDTDIVQKIKNIVAHEAVHTQQTGKLDKDAQKCGLLYACLIEGPCDFIGELLTGSQINKVAQEYGDAHEAALWKEFTNELCNESNKNWLYNFSTVKDRPADLGYYIGYKIAKAYYEKQADKKQAIIDIIEMRNPKKFLELSGYDPK